MPRKNLIISDQFPYHIRNRSNNKEFFYIPMPELWEIFLEVLLTLKKEYQCEIHAFVLMSNHYHLIIGTPKANLSEAMTYMHREVAKRANHKCRRSNHFFGGRYKWSLVKDDNYYWNVIKYVLRNPVSAKMVTKVQDYAYSSFNLSSDFLDFKNIFLFDNQSRLLNDTWLNTPHKEEEIQAISSGLRRKIFKLPKDQNRKQIKLNPKLSSSELT